MPASEVDVELITSIMRDLLRPLQTPARRRAFNSYFIILSENQQGSQRLTKTLLPSLSGLPIVSSGEGTDFKQLFRP